MYTIKSGNTIIVSGRKPMTYLPTAEHVRVVEIRLNHIFKARPVVVATVHSNSPGNTFAIWAMDYNILGAQTQIVIHATNTETGQPLDETFAFWCEFMITGELSA